MRRRRRRSKKIQEEQERVFSKLPPELVGLIMSKLPVPEHLRFSIICRRYLLAHSRHHSPPSPSPSPWLILPGRTSRTLKLIPRPNTTTRYITTIPDPLIRRRLFIGSSDGWLITLSDNSSLDIHLLNPLTGKQLLLPSITTLPFIKPVPHSGRFLKYHISHYKAVDHHHIHYFIRKAVISIKDFTVVLLHGLYHGKSLCYTRPNLSVWVPLDTPHYLYYDVIHHTNGLFCALAAGGSVLICGPSSTTRTLYITIPYYMMGSSNTYLVKSLDGHLLMVQRHLHHEGEDQFQDTQTSKFLVYKVEDKRRWVQTFDIGQQCLFLGTNDSMAFSAFKHPDLQPNCIYFTDGSIWEKRALTSWNQTKQCGVFNIKDGIIKSLFYPSSLTWPPPIWFTPCIEESHP